MGNAGNGVAASIPWRSSTGATGTPAAARRATSRVTGLGGDGPGDGFLELGAAPAAFVEAERRPACPSASAVAQADPEVLLVDDAERHLPAVCRGEEAVARAWARAAWRRPTGRSIRHRRDRSRWPARRSWRRRGTPLRHWSRGPARRRRSRRRRSARRPGRPSGAAGRPSPCRPRASTLPTTPGSSRRGRAGGPPVVLARNRRWSSRRCRGSTPARLLRRDPSRASTPGRNPSTSTSACLASSNALARPPPFLRSNSTLRLPPLREAKRSA